jgi:hypothetical protein
MRLPAPDGRTRDRSDGHPVLRERAAEVAGERHTRFLRDLGAT